MPDILDRLEKFSLYNHNEQREILDYAISEIRNNRNTMELMGREIERISPGDNPADDIPETTGGSALPIPDAVEELAKMGITAVPLDDPAVLHNTIAEAVGETEEIIEEPTFTDSATPEELADIYGGGNEDSTEINMTGLLNGTAEEADQGDGPSEDNAKPDDEGRPSGGLTMPDTN